MTIIVTLHRKTWLLAKRRRRKKRRKSSQSVVRDAKFVSQDAQNNRVNEFENLHIAPEDALTVFQDGKIVFRDGRESSFKTVKSYFETVENRLSKRWNRISSSLSVKSDGKESSFNVQGKRQRLCPINFKLCGGNEKLLHFSPWSLRYVNSAASSHYNEIRHTTGITGVEFPSNFLWFLLLPGHPHDRNSDATNWSINTLRPMGCFFNYKRSS